MIPGATPSRPPWLVVRLGPSNPAERGLHDTGVRVWGKQEKFETLMDPQDVGAGYVTRMRWRDEETWVRPSGATHPALVSKDLFSIAQGRMASSAPSVSRAKRTERPYQLRGVLVCGHCGRRMQGAWRSNRNDGSAGRLLYRCTLRDARTVPAELSDPPRSLYVREDAIVPALDAWIEGLTSPEMLSAVPPETLNGGATSALRQQIADLDRKIAALVTAVESGGDIAALTEQLSRRSRERDGLQARLRATPDPAQPTPAEMSAALAELGGVGALLGQVRPC